MKADPPLWMQYWALLDLQIVIMLLASLSLQRRGCLFIPSFILCSLLYLLNSEVLGIDAVIHCFIGLTTGRKIWISSWKEFLSRVMDNISSKVSSISDCPIHRQPHSPSTKCKIAELTSDMLFYHPHTGNVQTFISLG